MAAPIVIALSIVFLFGLLVGVLLMGLLALITPDKHTYLQGYHDALITQELLYGRKDAARNR